MRPNAWKQFLPLSIGGSFISRLVTFGSLNFLWIVVRPKRTECRSNFVEPSDWMNRRCTWLPPFLCSREISTHLSGTKTKKSDYCERKRWLKRKIAIGSFWNKISTFCFKASGSLFFSSQIVGYCQLFWLSDTTIIQVLVLWCKSSNVKYHGSLSLLIQRNYNFWGDLRISKS